MHNTNIDICFEVLDYNKYDEYNEELLAAINSNIFRNKLISSYLTVKEAHIASIEVDNSLKPMAAKSISILSRLSTTKLFFLKQFDDDKYEISFGGEVTGVLLYERNMQIFNSIQIFKWQAQPADLPCITNNRQFLLDVYESIKLALL